MNDPQPEGQHGKPHRTTKILSHARRGGGGVAAGGARAAAGAAGNWAPPDQITGRVDAFDIGVSTGTKRGRLRRGPERGDRIPLRGESIRSASGAGGRS